MFSLSDADAMYVGNPGIPLTPSPTRALDFAIPKVAAACFCVNGKCSNCLVPVQLTKIELDLNVTKYYLSYRRASVDEIVNVKFD